MYLAIDQVTDKILHTECTQPSVLNSCLVNYVCYVVNLLQVYHQLLMHASQTI